MQSFSQAPAIMYVSHVHCILTLCVMSVFIYFLNDYLCIYCLFVLIKIYIIKNVVGLSCHKGVVLYVVAGAYILLPSNVLFWYIIPSTIVNFI